MTANRISGLATRDRILVRTQTIGHAALATSSFSVPSATTFIGFVRQRSLQRSRLIPRCARPYVPFFIGRQDHRAWPWDGSARPPRSARSSESRRRDADGGRFRLGTPVAFELGPDPAERKNCYSGTPAAPATATATLRPPASVHGPASGVVGWGLWDGTVPGPSGVRGPM
jgi:hypothetical protein